MAMNRKSGLYSLLVTAILLAVGIVLPFLTGNVQVLGQAISPLHIPVLICGLTCWRAQAEHIERGLRFA